MSIYLATNRRFAENRWRNECTAHGEVALFEVTNPAELAGAGIRRLEAKEGVEEMGQRAIGLGARSKHQPLIVAFIHGYNNTIDSAVKTASDIESGLNRQGLMPVMVCFSWPADGDPTHYLNDRSDAIASAPAVAHIMNALRTNAAPDCAASICVIAHSMGNLVLREGLRLFSQQMGYPDSLPMLSEVLMVAADVDWDTLTRGGSGRPICQLSRRITAYYNRNDNTLAASQYGKNDATARLGRNGPADLISLDPKAVAVDCGQAIKPRGEFALAEFADKLVKIHSAYFCRESEFFEVPETNPFYRDSAFVLLGTDRNVIPGRVKPTGASEQAFQLA